MATVEDVLLDVDSRMDKSVDALISELNTIRTGRASPSLVENLSVDYYGASTPLNQLSSISVPEARLLVIQPWDKQAVGDIEKSILKSDLGLMPNSDGTVIRLNIPQLTEERRRDLVRLVGKRVEEGHVAVRNVRRDGLETLRSLEKGKEISQDELRRAQDDLQQITDGHTEMMEQLGKEKETEVMEV
jgi:ribosome recycling factor